MVVFDDAHVMTGSDWWKDREHSIKISEIIVFPANAAVCGHFGHSFGCVPKAGGHQALMFSIFSIAALLEIPVPRSSLASNPSHFSFAFCASIRVQVSVMQKGVVNCADFLNLCFFVFLVFCFCLHTKKL